MIKVLNKKTGKAIYIDGSRVNNMSDANSEIFFKFLNTLMEDSNAKCDKLITLLNENRFEVSELKDNHPLEQLF